MIAIIHRTSEYSLYTLKFQLPYHAVESSKIFGTLTVLEASLVKHFNLYINLSHREKFKLRSTIMAEILRRISSPNPTFYTMQTSDCQFLKMNIYV